MDFKSQTGFDAGFTFYQFCPMLACMIAAPSPATLLDS
jgi:hypothetical protein